METKKVAKVAKAMPKEETNSIEVKLHGVEFVANSEDGGIVISLPATRFESNFDAIQLNQYALEEMEHIGIDPGFIDKALDVARAAFLRSLQRDLAFEILKDNMEFLGD